MELNAGNLTNEIQSLIKTLKATGGWVKRGDGEGWFNHEILADALALITSQEQRIKELTEENEKLRAEVSVKRKLLDKAEVRIECVEEENNQLKADICNAEMNLHASCTELTQECKKWQGRLKIECEYTRSDTVRKMHAEIKERCLKGGIYPAFVASTIDKIAKEMLEENK